MDIKVLVMDVDGTLTDGKIYMSDKGEIMKAFNVKDGYAISHLKDYDIIPVIITGRKSEILRKRCEELNIVEYYQGVNNKVYKLRYILDKLNCTFTQTAYIGDDINDLDCILLCGLTGAPSDSASIVLKSVDYKCKAKGGNGAVREFIDYIVDNQKILNEIEEQNYDFVEIKYNIDE